MIGISAPKTPTKPLSAPLDYSTRKLIEKAYSATRSLTKRAPVAEIVKSVESLPNNDRVSLLMKLAMKYPFRLGSL